jgi:VanZ family protein
LGRLLLLTLVLIAYGSLYPWHFRSAPIGVSPFGIIEHSWPRHFDGPTVRDIAANVLLYLPVGLFGLLTFANRWAIVPTMLLGFTLSTVMEFSQVFVVGRDASLMDITSDTIGTAIGAAAGVFWRGTLRKTVVRPDAILLLVCWIFAQCFPFLPRLGTIVRGHPADALPTTAAAAALVAVVDSLGISRRRRITLVGAMLLLVPLRVLIFTRGVSLLEIAGAAAVFVAACVVRFRPTPTALFVALAIVIRGLAPFEFSNTPQRFSWLPFQASLLLEWEPALTILLGKVFLYGVLVWLIREAGARLALAVGTTAVLLALIEAIQRYIPAHSAEITDPVIAVLIGWVFWSLATPSARASSA